MPFNSDPVIALLSNLDKRLIAINAEMRAVRCHDYSLVLEARWLRKTIRMARELEKAEAKKWGSMHPTISFLAAMGILNSMNSAVVEDRIDKS